MATINIADLATELGTDPRTARKFMRSITPRDEQPGKGSRWGIEKREVRSLKSKFAKFAAELDAKRASRENAPDAPEQGDDAPATIDD
jgi:hypothetical protein